MLMFAVPPVGSAQNNIFQPIKDFSIVSPTVKITAYDLSYSGDIFPVRFGSGTLIDDQGIILVSNHVVQDEKEELFDAFLICFTVEQNKEPLCEYTGEVIARSKKYDVALIQLDAKDIRGNQVIDLPFLDYNIEFELKVGDKITVWGYQDVGGRTITSTQGVISGFEEVDQVNYIKSDSDLSSGGSGGTTLDGLGHFIGIPTVVKTGDETAESLGYSIDLRSVRSWISEHIRDRSERLNYNSLLAQKQLDFNDAFYSGYLDYQHYPHFSVDVDESWKFRTIEKSQVVLESLSNEQTYQILFTFDRLPFLANGVYLEDQFKKLERDKDTFKSYKREEILFHGVKAYRVTFDIGSSRYYVYVIPYGYTEMDISFGLDLKNLKRDEDKIEQVLSSLRFEDEPEQASELHTYVHSNPPFSISTSGRFLIQKQEHYGNKNALVNFLLQDNYEGKIRLTYDQLSESDKNLDMVKLLDNHLDSARWQSGFTLIDKDSTVTVDGLSGWSLTYGYDGDEYGKRRKSSTVFLRAGDDHFLFEYDDLELSYDRNIKNFKEILRFFHYEGEQQNKGVYAIGSLDYVFRDIVNHRFISEISNLQDKAIVQAYTDGMYRPEKPVSRAETLKIALYSQLYNKDKDLDKRSEINTYDARKHANLDFPDTKFGSWHRSYVRYARAKQLVIGYPDGQFYSESQITLAEALSMLLKAHELQIWRPSAFDAGLPWQKRYMDKGFELRLLPQGLTDPDHIVTRGELAYMVDTLMQNKDQF